MPWAPTLIKACSGETVSPNVRMALKGTNCFYDITMWEGPVFTSLIKSQFQTQTAEKKKQVFVHFLSRCNRFYFEDGRFTLRLKALFLIPAGSQLTCNKIFSNTISVSFQHFLIVYLSPSHTQQSFPVQSLYLDS